MLETDKNMAIKHIFYYTVINNVYFGWLIIMYYPSDIVYYLGVISLTSSVVLGHWNTPPSRRL